MKYIENVLQKVLLRHESLKSYEYNYFGVRIIEDSDNQGSDNRGSDNRGCTVLK